MRKTILAALVLLTGCSHFEYRAIGKGTQEFNHDSVECNVKTAQAQVNVYQRQMFYDQCMSGFGWAKYEIKD